MLANWLQESNYTVIFSGAGMSTESGLPDFRSSLTGLWKEKDPSLFASTHAMKYNREEFISFYRMRIEGLLSCQPNRGHHILTDWEQRGYVHAVITQNVDGFHQQAGSKNVTELHGSLSTVHCSQCGNTRPADSYLTGTVCDCGGFLRPSVVLFGEMLSEQALLAAEQEVQKAELCIVLGSSLQVSPANWYPQIAKEKGAKLVIINMEPTELDHLADLLVNGEKIGDYLTEVNQQLQ